MIIILFISICLSVEFVYNANHINGE